MTEVSDFSLGASTMKTRQRSHSPQVHMKMLHTVRIPAGDSSESDEMFIRSLSTSSMGSSSQQDSLESSYEWVAENKLGDSSEEVSSEQDWQPQTKSQRHTAKLANAWQAALRTAWRTIVLKASDEC